MNEQEARANIRLAQSILNQSTPVLTDEKADLLIDMAARTVGQAAAVPDDQLPLLELAVATGMALVIEQLRIHTNQTSVDVINQKATERVTKIILQMNKEVSYG